MNKIALSGIVAAAGLSASALAQQFTFESALVPDTTAGGINFPIGSQANVTATRVAFWLQARVMSTGTESYGIARASAPAAPDTSFIVVTDGSGGTTLGRGAINASGTQNGRGAGFRNGGTNVGSTGNNAGNAAFPGSTGNQNGGLDSGNTRIYSFDAYVGATRVGADPDEDGIYDNPWGVNGATPVGSGSPLPANTWSPWANLYRVWVDITNFNDTRDVTLSAHVMLNGTVHTADVGGGSFPLQLSNPGFIVDPSYTFHIVGVPTPGAAAVLGLGGLMVGRRRR